MAFRLARRGRMRWPWPRPSSREHRRGLHRAGRLFSLADPAGDDHGDGSLRYPLRDDLSPGDLDLRSITARSDPDGTMFEATFASPSAGRTSVSSTPAGERSIEIATLGFYTFNIDSTSTPIAPRGRASALLPGRVAEAASGSAWERAICLTPRPYLAQSQLVRIEAAPPSANCARRRRGSTTPRSRRCARRSQRRSPRAFSSHARLGRRRNGPVFRARVVPRGAGARPWGYIVGVSGSELEERLDLRGRRNRRQQPTGS